MRETLSSLTARGRAFLAAGAAAGGCALVLGQRDLLRVGVLLIALPLVTAAVLARSRYLLSSGREVLPSRVSAGEPARVVIRLQNAGRMPTGLLLLEDHVPHIFGVRPRFLVAHMGPRWRREVDYQVRSPTRGRYQLGPLSLRVSDPFGLVELSRSFRRRDVLVVTPQVQPLATTRVTGEWLGRGDDRPKALASAGHEDATVREYRDGDDLRRVHWRSTARRGELMVRREEQPWQNRCTLMLDTRRAAHRGSGPLSSFEWAVSAAASIGVHLAHHGYAVRLVGESGTVLAGERGDREGERPGEHTALLDTLAVARLSAATSLARPTSPTYSQAGLVVAVVGLLELADVAVLSRMRARAAAGLVIMLDAAAWLGRSAPEGRRTAARTREVTAALAASGWQVSVARPGDPVAAHWQRLGTGATRAAAPANVAREPGSPALTGPGS